MSSELVIFDIYGRITKGASVWPTKMFEATLSVSGPLVFIVFCITLAIHLVMNWVILKWWSTAIKPEKNITVGRALKAKLISNIDNIKIVDISHDISPFNLSEAGYVLEGAFRDFPKGTIHILSVDSELTPENRHIAII